MTVYDLLHYCMSTLAENVSVFCPVDGDEDCKLGTWDEYHNIPSSVENAEVMSFDINVIKGTFGYDIDIYLEDYVDLDEEDDDAFLDECLDEVIDELLYEDVLDERSIEPSPALIEKWKEAFFNE